MGFTTVHVSLTDQNDNIPQFLAQEFKITVLTTLPVNGTVMQVCSLNMSDKLSKNRKPKS